MTTERAAASEPRTEAGRALLDGALAMRPSKAVLRGDILAIEAEAAEYWERRALAAEEWILANPIEVREAEAARLALDGVRRAVEGLRLDAENESEDVYNEAIKHVLAAIEEASRDERQAGHRPEWADDVPTGRCECGRPHPHPTDDRQAGLLREAGLRYFAALDKLNGAHEARLAVGTNWSRLTTEHQEAEAALRAALAAAQVPACPECGGDARHSIHGGPYHDLAAAQVPAPPGREWRGDDWYEAALPAQEERLDVERLQNAAGAVGYALERLPKSGSKMTQAAERRAADALALLDEALRGSP